jgi:transposase
MPRPFSVDLRKRVVKAVNDGVKVSVVSERFQIGTRVIYYWLKLYRLTNDLEPKTGYQKGRDPRIKDWEEFKNFAQENRNCTIEQMKYKWDSFKNTIVAKSVIERGLRKIGFTSKKKLLSILKQAQKNVQNL